MGLNEVAGRPAWRRQWAAARAPSVQIGRIPRRRRAAAARDLYAGPNLPAVVCVGAGARASSAAGQARAAGVRVRVVVVRLLRRPRAAAPVLWAQTTWALWMTSCAAGRGEPDHGTGGRSGRRCSGRRYKGPSSGRRRGRRRGRREGGPRLGGRRRQVAVGRGGRQQTPQTNQASHLHMLRVPVTFRRAAGVSPFGPPVDNAVGTRLAWGGRRGAGPNAGVTRPVARLMEVTRVSPAAASTSHWSPAPFATVTSNGLPNPGLNMSGYVATATSSQM